MNKVVSLYKLGTTFFMLIINARKLYKINQNLTKTSMLKRFLPV